MSEIQYDKQYKGDKDVHKKIQKFKKRYYANFLIKGSLLFTALVLSLYVFFNLIEHIAEFNRYGRTFIFYLFVILSAGALIYWVINPLLYLLGIRKTISDEEAAQKIGNYFPGISDKLLNLLQLENIADKNDLAKAAIENGKNTFKNQHFEEAVETKKNKRYVPYAILPVFLIALIVVISPSLFTKSTKRIIEHQRDFLPELPFKLKVQNESLLAFQNEDFTLNIQAVGESLPADLYLVTDSRRIKMQKEPGGLFKYTFPKMQSNESFDIEALGLKEGPFFIVVKNRPNLRGFNVDLKYPSYTKIPNEQIANLGNLTVPEGTEASWIFNTLDADSLSMFFPTTEEIESLESKDKNLFSHTRVLTESGPYEIKLSNEFSPNIDQIIYQIDVIKDQYPKITFEQFKDTTLYKYIIFGGNLTDDYGISSLNLYYKKEGEKKYKRQAVSIAKNKAQQGYYYQWPLDSLKLTPGQNVSYYLQVADNDQVNGAKTAKTATFSFKTPEKSEIKESIAQSSSNNQKDIEKSIREAKEVRDNIKNIENRIKGKKYLDWQDRKMLEALVEQKKELDKELEELQKQHKEELAKRSHFDEMDKNDKIAEKAKELQKLMSEVLDEETKELYRELQKLLEEKQSDVNDINDKLDEISSKEQNLEQELERTLELFKRMKFDFKAEEISNKLEELQKREEELSNEKITGKNFDEIAEKQKDIDKEFDDLEKEFKELSELNQDMKNPEAMPNTSEERNNIQNEQGNFQNAHEQNKKKQANESQKQMSKEMQKLAQKMRDMQASSEMTSLNENLDNLRFIQSNLIKISFDQEDLIKEFRKVNQSDPKFVELSQGQLKIKDDSKIINDSLIALSQRVFQLSSFVTRELNDMNTNIDNATIKVKERKVAEAMAKQQFAMTSMNNLALMLDQVMTQMQQQMQNAMGNSDPKQKGGKPKLSDLQKQLNEKIKNLKKSGKKGRQLSEELSKLASEQEKIRRALEQDGDKKGKIDPNGKPSEGEGEGEKEGKENGGGNPYKKLAENMENTEIDLVNKRLTQEMINRQEDILTKMLEAENAEREDEYEKEREAEQASSYEQVMPKAFEEYIKLKEKELERLKTVPLRFNKYYKEEVNRYFNNKNKQKDNN
ncbi:DUF4175 family protein [Aureibacter tunicatorum]|uniref:ATPase n=1 Tax=Aureibacter tunicatorum TaxID=866807 RepID=A0AAE3XM58_9BACT|nr:DUF4175 family protein [Aureibacter tunicatorum]MDR6237484.1 hypothetical protein [Aureibacter tunicatorum]BDD02518.1 hypothetical protein AUTU_00010 [Aureibacter tunicatorum]